MRLRRVLVAAQMAVAVIVLATGFVFLTNLFHSAAIDPGFDVRNTLQAHVGLPPGPYKDPERHARYVNQALRALEVLPGIEAAAAARNIPFNGGIRHHLDLTFPDTGEKTPASYHWNAVTAAFFHAMDVPVLAGRPFSSNDRGAAKVVIVNRTFVERYLGDRNAVGTVFLQGPEKAPHEIVGVVGGTKTLTIGEDDQPQLYQPLAQSDYNRPKIRFVMRSATPPPAQIDSIRRVLRSIEPAASLEVTPLYNSIGLAFLPSQIGAALLGSIGILGLLLAAIGLYGVMAYSVARRTREIAVRIAVGAGNAEISRMVGLEAAKLMVSGSAIGLMIALFVTRPLAMFLVPGLSPTDPVTFAFVLTTLAATGLLATLGPVRRALTIDPMASLRSE
ncbi:MAG: FtsX-like permease family protein [Luteitalea sp.]|nr:FtsX-like permease family protein [Luteitalea sp.]